MAHEKTYPLNYQSKTLYGFTNVLHQHLSQQCIDIYGVNSYYIPKENYAVGEVDLIFQEVAQKKYHRLFKMRMLLADTSMFENGENSMFSQLGLTINDQIRLVVTIKEFYERINGDTINPSNGKSEYEQTGGKVDYTQTKPRIGDLIFLDQFDGKLFQITSVDEANTRYSRFNLGTTWNIVCDLWEGTSNDTIEVAAETGDSDETVEFANIINGVQTNIQSTDLTEEDVQNANETGVDVGSGVYGEDNLNDNYRKEGINTVRNTNKDNPFDTF